MEYFVRPFVCPRLNSKICTALYSSTTCSGAYSTVTRQNCTPYRRAQALSKYSTHYCTTDVLNSIADAEKQRHVIKKVSVVGMTHQGKSGTSSGVVCNYDGNFQGALPSVPAKTGPYVITSFQ
jgi:hypothetical protein